MHLKVQTCYPGKAANKKKIKCSLGIYFDIKYFEWKPPPLAPPTYVNNGITIIFLNHVIFVAFSCIWLFSTSLSYVRFIKPHNLRYALLHGELCCYIVGVKMKEFVLHCGCLHYYNKTLAKVFIENGITFTVWSMAGNLRLVILTEKPTVLARRETSFRLIIAQCWTWPVAMRESCNKLCSWFITLAVSPQQIPILFYVR